MADIEEFVRLGHLWSNDGCVAMVELLNAESNRLSNAAALFQALGGGWGVAPQHR